MRSKLQLIASLISFILSISVCFANPNSSEVIKVKPGATFSIPLDSNPTTGYSWELANYDQQFLTSLGHQYAAPKTNLVGAGGIDTWKFKVNKYAQGETTLNFVYRRPWEGSNESASHKSFKVKVG